MTHARFRLGLPYRLAMLVWLIAALPLTAQKWWLVPLLAIPLVFLAYALRAGVDADRRGVTVRALLGSRHLPWSSVRGFRARRGRVFLLLADGRGIGLPGLRQDDLPALIAASGQQVTAPAPREEEAATEAAEPAATQSAAPAEPAQHDEAVADPET